MGRLRGWGVLAPDREIIRRLPEHRGAARRGGRRARERQRQHEELHRRQRVAGFGLDGAAAAGNLSQSRVRGQPPRRAPRVRTPLHQLVTLKMARSLVNTLLPIPRDLGLLVVQPALRRARCHGSDGPIRLQGEGCDHFLDPKHFGKRSRLVRPRLCGNQSVCRVHPIILHQVISRR